MKNLFRFVQFVAQFITLGLALAFVISLLSPQWVERLRGQVTSAPSATAPAAQPASVEPAIGFGPAIAGHAAAPAANAQTSTQTATTSYAHAVRAAAPAVVSIYADKVKSVAAQQMSLGVVVPSNPRLREFLVPIPVGPPFMQNQTTQSLGSGVVVDSEAHMLTNYHVIENATDINAVLQDGRIVHAKYIGGDKESDLAVLQLDLYNTTYLGMAEQSPSVGDVVLAIGSPFGLSNTVTMGIVSALGRPISPDTSEEFIQTDAAINAGNSGGALVNAAGELVGINSETYSPPTQSGNKGGNIGIGFAIPVATAKKVLSQILQYGHVIRGSIGASYADAAPIKSDPMPVINGGVKITSTEPAGPAAQAGILPGDIVTRLDGKWIPNQFALRNLESHMAPGTKVSVSGLRDGLAFTYDIVLEEKPQPVEQTSAMKPDEQISQGKL